MTRLAERSSGPDGALGPLRGSRLARRLTVPLPPLSCSGFRPEAACLCGPSVSTENNARAASDRLLLAPAWAGGTRGNRWLRSLRDHGWVTRSWHLRSSSPSRGAIDAHSSGPPRGPSPHADDPAARPTRDARASDARASRPTSTSLRSGAVSALACVPRRPRSRTRRCARSRACASPTATRSGPTSRGVGHNLQEHSRGARARRPREGPAGRPLPHRARHARHAGRRRIGDRAARGTARSARSNGFRFAAGGARATPTGRRFFEERGRECPGDEKSPRAGIRPIRSTATARSATSRT